MVRLDVSAQIGFKKARNSMCSGCRWARAGGKSPVSLAFAQRHKLPAANTRHHATALDVFVRLRKVIGSDDCSAVQVFRENCSGQLVATDTEGFPKARISYAFP